jgi:zinc protease
MDSKYYGTEKFAGYVRDGLNQLTLADVNRVIQENLDIDNVQYVFVSKNAEELRESLWTDRASPLSYDAEKPPALLQEDKAIEGLPLGMTAEDVRILKADEVFGAGT